MQISKILTFISLIFIANACKETSTKTDSIFKFRDYISYTTSGVVSAKAPIKIVLSKEVEGWMPEMKLDNDIIEITPYVQGTLQTVNKHTLIFTPDEPLESATEYTVRLKLNDIYKTISEDFQQYTFQFKTITPSFTVYTENVQSYSKEWQYVLGHIRSADVITLNDAKRLITASQEDANLNIHWEDTSELSKYFEFKIDSVHRKVEDSKIKVVWDGKSIKADNKGENFISIPGKNNFTIIDTEVHQTPEQYLSINFSDPLKKEQNFLGLVTLEKVKNPKYVVDGNILKVYPDTKLVGNVLVDVFTGIKNSDGYKLKQAFSKEFTFEELKPQVRLLSSGTILPNSKDLKFNFEAVNLSKVDIRVIKLYEDNILQFLQSNNINSSNEYSIKSVGRRIAKETITLVQDKAQNTGKWKAYSIDLSKYLLASPGAIYRVEVSFKQNYSLYNCDDNSQTITVEQDDDYNTYYEEDFLAMKEVLDEDEALREERYWDNLAYSYKNTNYHWRDRDNPCTESYFNYNRSIAQNLISSNLGVIAKQGTENTYFFAATNILNTQPEGNTTISLYNYQQQEIASGLTNKDGVLKIDSKKRASFAIAKKGKNVSYIKLFDGNSLSLSKFDVSGKRLQRGLKGYIYGERGVWRPGDSLFLTFILNDAANKLPKRHPIKLEITDPLGKLVYRKIAIDNINNFYDFKVPTSTDYKTGNYNAKVYVGGAVFSKPLKIETVKPNRLKINIDFEGGLLKTNTPINGTLNVAWLHGAPAKYLKAEIKAKFTSSYTSFKGYKDYVFSDPSREFNTSDTNIFEGKLDKNGTAVINSKLTVGKNAPGMLNAQFLVRAFENGGDYSLDTFSMNYAPYESFVGLKSPKSRNYGSFYTNEDHVFNIATVSANGKPISRSNLQVKVYKIEWRWWWNSSYDNLSRYTSSQYHRPVQNFLVSTNKDGKANFQINIPEDERGRYLIRIEDPVSGHAAGRTAYFYRNWWSNSSSNNKESAKMLVFSTGKTKYNVGETATLTFPSGSQGRALISIENGTEVLNHQWVKTQKGETTIQIPITADMAPNVFINISLLQPHDVTTNDLPIRLYGVIPLMVENPETKLQPVITMPSTIRPEENYEIKVSEKNNKAMTYTIAVVEEGLLDLTRFKTPNAWSTFYAREALGVKTWDVFDNVAGAYSGSIDQVFAIGGDGSAQKGKNKKANRFKPVVTYLGPFLLAAGKTQTHKLKMPNYIGAVKTMVVAGNNVEEAYGSAEKSVKVKKPLMVLSSLPRKLSPGEKVTLPVTVFAMDNKIKDVSLSLKLSKGITVKGNAKQMLQFRKPNEQMAYFELDVTKAKGVNTIEVVAKGHGEIATHKVEIDVENPNPISSKIIDAELQANATQTINFNTFGVPGTNSATVEFSTLPPMDFTKRLSYLIRYPHGCVEQTTSSVFPQLFLADIFDLPSEKQKDIQRNIEKGIKRLGHFQQTNGGLSYWIGENNANDWGTSYAGHFMIEAEKKGFVLPLSFKSNWIAYQKKASREWRANTGYYRTDLAQAYRLYTLALAGSPDLASMNRLREMETLSNDAKWRLSAAYALVGQKEASKAISNSANIDFEPTKYNYYTYGSVDRNRAMALETMLLIKDSKRVQVAKDIAKSLSSNQWMSTQTTAYALLAMGKMIVDNGGKDMNLTYTINGKSETIDTKNGLAQRQITVADGLNEVTVKNNDNNVVYVRIANSGKLKLGEELSEQRGFFITTIYKDLQGNTIDVSKLKQGQDFVATVSISNLTNTKVKDVALTQIFPSGWEIVNTRFTNFGDTTVSKARYTDIRDNSVNFYFDMNKKGVNGIKTFTVMLNASYLGTYYLPGSQAEAMYDNDYLVRNKGKWVTIGK